MILQTKTMPFYCPKKCTFCSTSGHNTLSYHEKFRTLFQMTYTIGMVRPRQFIEPGFGVSIYFDFNARLFSTQCPTYGAHILQGLLTNYIVLLHSFKYIHIYKHTYFGMLCCTYFTCTSTCTCTLHLI